jgi:hypothetical protein
MIITVTLILVLVALGTLIANIAGKIPLWVTVLILVLIHLVGILPIK